MNPLALYSPSRQTRSEDWPARPFVHAMVGACTKVDGHTLLSAQLMTNQEIDEFVNELKIELEEFSEAAKKELRKLKQV